MKNDEWITGNIKLSLGGQPLEMQMTVPAQPVKPQRMLPIFQQMTNSFIEIAENAVEISGDKISCQKGCASCCRQAIPLAEIEVYRIAEIVETLPEPRRTEIKNRFKTAWHHFFEIGWFERLENCVNVSQEECEKVILEYLYEDVSCPFLEDESCAIHLERPLTCREYMVTSPAENCDAPSAEKIRLVKLPVKSSEIVRKITNSANLNKSINFVPLVLALEWVKRNADEFPEKTGEQWMADFFTNLTKSEIPKEMRNEK